MQILKKLLSISSLSGNESAMRDFLIGHFMENIDTYVVKPELLYGKGFQDCLVVVFGKPRTAVFAHMDTVGFMVRYDSELTEVGQPHTESGYMLSGTDSSGPVECSLIVEIRGDEPSLYYDYFRTLDRGTELSFKADFIEDGDYIQSPYLDNRIGIWNALELAKTLTDGMLIFSCYEEHSGGTSGYLAKFAYEKFGVSQALISDVTWVTHGIKHNEGAVISLRDSGIPRKVYLDRILKIVRDAGIKYQLEVESTGGSDGNELQKSPYPIDWCFVGIAESNVHSPTERVHKADLQEMLKLYKVLMKNL
jgi:putative aminopeptidase FrvX